LLLFESNSIRSILICWLKCSSINFVRLATIRDDDEDARVVTNDRAMSINTWRENISRAFEREREKRKNVVFFP